MHVVGNPILGIQNEIPADRHGQQYLGNNGNRLIRLFTLFDQSYLLRIAFKGFSTPADHLQICPNKLEQLDSNKFCET